MMWLFIYFTSYSVSRRHAPELGAFKTGLETHCFVGNSGVIVSALLVGYPLSYFWHIPLNYAFLFGALISPTDPVSVLAIMKKIKAPERLRTILEAESLFNDGTGVIICNHFNHDTK